MDNKKKIFSVIFFLIVFFLTIYTFFSGQSILGLVRSMCQMNGWCLLLAAFLGIFFVSMEGIMIGILLKAVGEKTSFLRCIQYSFIGFFYSGITPSATGGQPMQLYYMKKDGRKTSTSTVILMTVAALYKFVLVLIGIFLLIFWKKQLHFYLHSYFYLYLVGLFLNTILVIFILAVMCYPVMIHKAGIFLIHKLGPHILKKDPEVLTCKWNLFIQHYQDAVLFLKAHKGLLCSLIFLTFLQRCSVFLVTFLVYRGFFLNTYDSFTIMAIQASVYIAVDMMPVPGSQGITEAMYHSVFYGIFPSELLTPSMLVSRGLNFYFLLLISIAVVLFQKWKQRKLQ